MGREVRRVPANWEHPKDESGEYIPLLDGSFSEDLARWNEGKLKWDNGLVSDWNGGWKAKPSEEECPTFEDWDGECPEAKDYMPEWPEEEKTHLMMYETCSEGTPISPAFEKAEDLAHWLADNGASSFGSDTASYEAWLETIQGGFAPTAVFIPGMGVVSGVEFMKVMNQKIIAEIK